MLITVTPDADGYIKIVDALVPHEQWMQALNVKWNLGF